MQYKSLNSYFWFGASCRFLQDASKGYDVKGEGGVLYNLWSFFSMLDELGLPVTKRLAESELARLYDALHEYRDAQRLSLEHATTLKAGIKTVRTTLDAERQGIGAYTPIPKRLDLAKLLDNVQELFAPTVFDALPEPARYDLNEAGKCIAFERPTAAAFHILRAPEGVLRFYYQTMVRQKRVSSLNWGPIGTDLRKRNRTKPYSVLNNHLDNIRDSFRNPTQHPDAQYDIQEVQDLWSLCVDVIDRMTGILNDEGLN